MENINLLRKIAWSFHKTTGLDWDDLFQEAVYAYMKGLQNYDSSKGKISTYMWWYIGGHLKNYLKDELNYSKPLDSLDTIQRKTMTPSMFFENLTSEAMEIASILLENPTNYTCLPQEEAKVQIIQTLLEKGWSENKIKAGLINLLQACS